MDSNVSVSTAQKPNEMGECFGVSVSNTPQTENGENADSDTFDDDTTCANCRLDDGKTSHHQGRHFPPGGVWLHRPCTSVFLRDYNLKKGGNGAAKTPSWRENHDGRNDPDHPRWNEFAEALAQKMEWFHDGRTWLCDGDGSGASDPAKVHRHAKHVMAQMGGVDIPASLAYFGEHGGHCDCEILWNVDPEGGRKPMMTNNDWMDGRGAALLAAMIKSYWRSLLCDLDLDHRGAQWKGEIGLLCAVESHERIAPARMRCC
jgi:hypothetical protein